MEATGVYWKPVLYALESRFAVWLCNARAVKKVPGRKTDLTDAEWLSDVAAHGMVRPSFVSPPPIRELRARKGDRVSAGQVVAKLEDRDVLAQRAEAAAMVEDAQASLQKISAGTIPAEMMYETA